MQIYYDSLSFVNRYHDYPLQIVGTVKGRMQHYYYIKSTRERILLKRGTRQKVKLIICSLANYKWMKRPRTIDVWVTRTFFSSKGLLLVTRSECT